MTPMTTPPAHPTTHGDRSHHVKRETAMTLIEEALARSHQHEAQQAADEHRCARRLTAGRRWTRLSNWAATRAERARARHL